MARLRSLLTAWRETPHIGALAVLGGLAVLALGPYLYLRQYRYVLTDPDGFIFDFSFFYNAAHRVIADPATLYADVQFIYPPPSVVLFLAAAGLPQWLAYLVWNGLTVGLAVACFRMTLALYPRTDVRPISNALAIGLVLIGLGSGPLFQNLKYGQVNVLVLLAGLLMLRWLRTDRPFQAALALCGGFWLKLYPAVLAPLAWRTTGPGRFVAGLALGLIGLPLLLASFLPLSLYTEFFFERVPMWAGITSKGALNASITGVLTRCTLPPEAALRNLEVAIPGWVGGVNTVLGALLFGGLALAHGRGHLDRPTAGVIGLALIPVCSTLGWEHTYLLALPLVLFALLDARTRTARWLTAGCALLLMLPRPPIRVLTALVEHAPRLVVDGLNARYLFVTLVLAALVARWAWRPQTALSSVRGRTKSAPAP